MTIAQAESLQPLIVAAQPLRDLLEARLIRCAQPLDARGDRLPPRDALLGARGRPRAAAVQPLDPRHHRRIALRVGLDQQPPHLARQCASVARRTAALLVRVRRRDRASENGWP